MARALLLTKLRQHQRDGSPIPLDLFYALLNEGITDAALAAPLETD